MNPVNLFLICALAVPATNFTRPSIVRWQAAKSEQERLENWIRKNNPDAKVFIHPDPQKDKLKENGYERLPFNWRGNQIWIQRKPKSDKKMMETSA